MVSIPQGRRGGAGGPEGGDAQGGPTPAALHRVFEAARLLVGYRERAAAMAAGRFPPVQSLADAIRRDFIGFDVQRAEQALRAAVIAADPDIAPVRLACPEPTPDHADDPAPAAAAAPPPGPATRAAGRRGRRRSGVPG
jgi:hypothetical protein